MLRHRSGTVRGAYFPLAAHTDGKRLRTIIISSDMHVTAIIAAAGSGSRLGASIPKQLLDVGGRSILARSVAAFDTHPAIAEVIVVTPALLMDSEAFASIGRTQHDVRLVAGGAR